MADNGGLQFLTETRKKIEVSVPGQNRLLVFSLIFLAVILAIYGGLVYYKGSLTAKLDQTNQRLVEIEKARNKKNEESLLKLKSDLALVKPLIENHISWSEAFARIQNLVIPQVQFDSLYVKLDKKEFSFKAFAPSFTVVAKQLAVFYADNAIRDVSVGKVSSLSNAKVEFSAQLVLDLDKIIKKNSPQ